MFRVFAVLSFPCFMCLLAGCPAAPAAAPATETPVVLQTYDVPASVIQEVESVLQSVFARGNRDLTPMGTVTRTPNGQLLIAAPAETQESVAAVLKQMNDAPAAPAPPVIIDYWVVVGRRADARTKGDAVQKEIGPTLETLQDTEGPMQLALLEHLSARSVSGDRAKLDGRRFMVSQRAVVQGDRVLAELMVNRMTGAGHLEGRVVLPLDQTLVFGQAGIEMLPDDVMDRSGETTAFYIVRARAAR